MIVMPLTSARTSRRRFTLMNVFSAVVILSFEMLQPTAKAAAAVAFKTLYSPPRENSKSAQCSPSCSTDQLVRAGSSRRFVIRQVEFCVAPYRSTGQRSEERRVGKEW